MPKYFGIPSLLRQKQSKLSAGDTLELFKEHRLYGDADTWF